LTSIQDAIRVERAKQPRFNTNEGFILNIMNVSPYGGMCQAFIMEAIRHYSTTVAASAPGPEDPESMAIVSPQLWHAIAVDIRDRINTQLKITT